MVFLENFVILLSCLELGFKKKKVRESVKNKRVQCSFPKRFYMNRLDNLVYHLISLYYTNIFFCFNQEILFVSFMKFWS
jgi:hypothetical protein